MFNKDEERIPKAKMPAEKAKSPEAKTVARTQRARMEEKTLKARAKANRTAASLEMLLHLDGEAITCANMAKCDETGHTD